MYQSELSLDFFDERFVKPSILRFVGSKFEIDTFIKKPDYTADSSSSSSSSRKSTPAATIENDDE